MGSCNSTTNCNPCGPDFNAINQLATQTAVYARQANTSATNAENSFLEFNALYLGAFASAPAVDNEGNPIQVGALYWNSVSNEMFVWNGTAWLPDAFNEFTPFLATGTTFARNLVTRMADVVNVKDFGAVGNFNPTTQSGSDDTAAFNAAIAVANASTNGKAIYIPQGNYKITSNLTTITIATSFLGESENSTNLFFKNCDGFSYNLSPYTILKDRSSSIHNISLYTDRTTKKAISYINANRPRNAPPCNLDIQNVSALPEWRYNGSNRPADPNNQYWLNGIYMVNAENSVIQNYYYNGDWRGDGTTFGIGIVIDDCLSVEMRSVKIYSCYKGITVTGQTEGVFIHQTTIVQVNVGIEFFDLVNPANNHVIADTHIDPFDCGISMADDLGHDPQSVYISNCFILEREGSRASYTHIKFNCHRSTITNTTLQSNAGSTASVTGILLSNRSNVVSNVIFRNCTNIINILEKTTVEASLIAGCIITNRVGRPYTLLSGGPNLLVNVSNIIEEDNRNLLRSYTGNFEVYDQYKKLKLRTTTTQTLLGDNDSNVRFIDMKSSIGATSGFDSRILSSGGSNTNGTANLIFEAGEHIFSEMVRPLDDNLYSLGAGAKRWSVVYAGTGAINTSDQNEKQQIRNISDTEKAVAIKLKSLFKAYKWNDAVEKKGENARIHFGVIAQEVKEAFESEGLDASAYGMFCYNEWDSTEEIKDENGEVLVPGNNSGSRYGVRYDELFAFILANT
jgi:hypothetical protein